MRRGFGIAGVDSCVLTEDDCSGTGVPGSGAFEDLTVLAMAVFSGVLTGDSGLGGVELSLLAVVASEMAISSFG